MHGVRVWCGVGGGLRSESNSRSRTVWSTEGTDEERRGITWDAEQHLGGGEKGLSLFVKRFDEFLNRLHLLLFEEGLATLFAHPRRDVIQREMAPVPIDMQGSRPFVQPAAAVEALHLFDLTRKSGDQSCRLGRYTVIRAR